jgi:alpha-ketoglutarate-dependent taurine dioxygenase
MRVVEVDAGGLQVLAQEAEGLAGEFVSSSPPATSGNSWQPTAAAVQTVNASLVEAAQTLATRMSTTAEKLSAGGAGYTAEDERSAADIRTLKL